MSHFRFKILGYFFLGLTIMSCSTPNKPINQNSMHPNKKVIVHGHRGARSSLPENTLAGFQFALEQGVDVLELDLAVTKDRVVVVSHDPYVNPVLCLDPQGRKIAPDQKALIKDLTYNELKKYDCGSLRNPRFSNQELRPKSFIPTLDDVFNLVKNQTKYSHIAFNIETKVFPDQPQATIPYDEFAISVINVVRKHKMIPRTILQSFDQRTLDLAKVKEPDLQLNWLVEKVETNTLDVAKQKKYQILSPYFESISSDDVRQFHTQNIQVIPWTVNEPKDWKTMLKMGVDGIITDDPKALMAWLSTQY